MTSLTQDIDILREQLNIMEEKIVKLTSRLSEAQVLHDKFCAQILAYMPDEYNSDETIEELILQWAKDQVNPYRPIPGDIIYIGTHASNVLYVDKVNINEPRRINLTCGDGRFGGSVKLEIIREK